MLQNFVPSNLCPEITGKLENKKNDLVGQKTAFFCSILKFSPADEMFAISAYIVYVVYSVGGIRGVHLLS